MLSIGNAPNNAAKLSEIRDGYSLTITQDVYAAMDSKVAVLTDGSNFWTRENDYVSGEGYRLLYRTNAWWDA